MKINLKPCLLSKKEQAEKFKAYCAERGKTSNAVLRTFVMECIGETTYDSEGEA